MQIFIRKNFIAFVLPILLLIRGVSEISTRIMYGLKIDWGEIAFYVLAILISFGVVYIALEVGRSPKLWPKTIFGFLYSLFVTLFVDYLIVLNSYCFSALNKDPQGFSFLAVLIGFPLYAFLSSVLLIVFLGITRNNAHNRDKYLHISTILIPWVVGIVLLLLMALTWGRYSNVCIIVPR